MPYELSDRYFDVDEVGEALSIHPESVRRLIRQGRLAAMKLGTKWLVDERALLDFKQEYDELPRTWSFTERPSAPDGYVFTAEAAERVGVSHSTITQWANDGQLPAQKSDEFGRWLIMLSDLENFLSTYEGRELPPIDQRDFYTVMEVAQLERVSYATILSRVRNGSLAATKARYRWQINKLQYRGISS